MSKWRIGVYLRLSSEDGDKEESNSITMFPVRPFIILPPAELLDVRSVLFLEPAIMVIKFRKSLSFRQAARKAYDIAVKAVRLAKPQPFSFFKGHAPVREDEPHAFFQAEVSHFLY